MLGRARREQERVLPPQSNATPGGTAIETTPEVIIVEPKTGPDDALAADRAREEGLRAEIARKIEEAKREAEIDQVVERLRQAREAANKPVVPQPAYSSKAEGVGTGAGASAIGSAVTKREASSPPVTAADHRATVLLVMEPGSRGIRRFNKHADPVLCLRTVCYISRGPEQDAEAMPRARALGAANTLGRRAGACRNSLGCVFRNIDLGGDAAWVQPIDLRIIRHDRRQPGFLRVDQTCSAAGGEVACSQGLAGPDYRIWVLPEQLARRVPPHALNAAVGAGLTVAGSLPHSMP
ncbi:MAG: hypothetical protein AB7K04_09980 [Pseudorhodoplanes sp.]